MNVKRVHVLHKGLPLCGFTRDIPAEWPPGHSWLGALHLDDPKLYGAAEPDKCTLCWDRAKEMK